jgi:DNA polymerase II
MDSIRCFLLTCSYRDINGHFEITLHGATEDGLALVAVVDSFRPLFFVSRSTPESTTSDCAERRSLELASLYGEPVDCLYFATLAAARDTAQRLRSGGARVYESDVSPLWRYLMERSVKGGFVCEGDFVRRGTVLTVRNPRVRGADVNVSLRVLSMDIETHVATGELYSIACAGSQDQVFLRAAVPARPSLTPCADEREVLQRFLAYVAQQDPDVLIGWNVVEFDLRFLEQRCRALRVPFTLGRGAVARVVEQDRPGMKHAARVPGRVVLDGPSMLRAFNYTFEEYSLDFVAHAMLGKGKLIGEHGQAKIDAIDRLYREDPVALARYNLLDARLTKEIFDRAGILPDAIERARLSGHLLDRTGGSVAAFDFLYLPLLHRAGYVARDVDDVGALDRGLSGGFVMDPKPGIYRNVALLDFRSLYPSIIMTFLIDPLGYALQGGERVSTPANTSFRRYAAILPGVIRELLAAREEAKKTGNKSLSLAIKILMNSFYGVLGTPGCRFFAVDLAQSITETGQYLFRETARHIEETTPYQVIYGDTDSMFVLMGEGHDTDGAAEGKRIAAEVTQWLARLVRERFDTESALLLQFERHFLHFLIPSVRGGTEGSKKHYCGAEPSAEGLKLLFKGMESARTDWTDLAKDFQHELCLRLFQGQPVEDLVRSTVDAVRGGRLDGKLVYRKRIRKRLDEYSGSTPPHVQAALQLDNPGGTIRYVITTEGPQPIEKRTAPLDYDHYVDTQLRPVADSLLGFVGLDFERLVSGQQDLFD